MEGDGKGELRPGKREGVRTPSIKHISRQLRLSLQARRATRIAILAYRTISSGGWGHVVQIEARLLGRANASQPPQLLNMSFSHVWSNLE